MDVFVFIWRGYCNCKMVVDILDTTSKLPVEEYKMDIVWINVILFALLHIGAFYGAYLIFTKILWATVCFTVFLYFVSIFGITAGAHRLWSHKSYKAKFPLRLMLTIFNSVAFQNSVIEWVRDHWLHHKYVGTNADPHNANRGFFFSHMGWLLVRKHPQIKAKGSSLDLSELLADPLLRFQHRYYFIAMPVFCFILPTYIPTLWGESLWNGLYVCVFFRYTYVLHVTWLINSAAHIWGYRPYEKYMNSGDIKPVSLFALGEGFHNYHHVFPWDYKAAELKTYTFNLSTLFIDAMAKIGWAYDLKAVSYNEIEKRVKRTGDGSHLVWKNMVYQPK